MWETVKWLELFGARVLGVGPGLILAYMNCLFGVHSLCWDTLLSLDTGGGA